MTEDLSISTVWTINLVLSIVPVDMNAYDRIVCLGQCVLRQIGAYETKVP